MLTRKVGLLTFEFYLYWKFDSFKTFSKSKLNHVLLFFFVFYLKKNKLPIGSLLAHTRAPSLIGSTKSAKSWAFQPKPHSIHSVNHPMETRNAHETPFGQLFFRGKKSLNSLVWICSQQFSIRFKQKEIEFSLFSVLNL